MVISSFYSEAELQEIGLKSWGKNVMISRKCSIYSAGDIEIGNNVRVDDFCILSGKIILKDYIHIAAYSALYGGEAGIFIESFANISSRVCIYSINDDYSGESMTNPMVPTEYRHVESAPVIIERHVIIGSTSVVMPGVHLANGSSFGSFSFINRDSEAWSINAGIPFEKIKNRSKNAQAMEKQFMKVIG